MWCHPLDLHFASKSLEAWPRMRFIVWRLNGEGIIGAHSYGTLALPTAPGHYELKCATWSIKGSAMEEIYANLLGPRPQLLRANVIDISAEKRAAFQTVTSGYIHLSLDVVFRNAVEQDIRIMSVSAQDSNNS